MSFDYNPFKHIELVDDPPVEGYSTTMDSDTYAIYCHGCGSSKDRIPKDAPASRAFEVMDRHVRRSHNYTPEILDERGWSAY